MVINIVIHTCFCIGIFGSPAISSEIENKTAFYIFPLPINRHKLFVGKFLAAFSVTLVIVLIYIIVEAATLSFIFKKPPEIYFYYSLVLLILFVLSMTSLTFMISAIFNKNTYAYISVLLIYYIVFYAGSFIIELLYKIDPFYLLSDAASIIQRVYVNINTEDFFCKTEPCACTLSRHYAGRPYYVCIFCCNICHRPLFV